MRLLTNSELPNEKLFQLTLKFVVLFVLVVVLFWHTFVTLWERFGARDSYYSHGFIVPFIVLYLVWNKRNKLRGIKLSPSLWGVPIVLAGCLLHLVSAFLKINFTSYLAIPMVIGGIVYTLGGGKLLYELLFPIGFLIFMLPLPKVLIIGITFKLKLLVAGIATYLAHYIGINAEQVGSTIYYPGGYLIVGDPCSGLRSLISFLALGALLTQFMSAPRWKKLVFFLCSVPIALVSNVARVFFLLLVSYVYGERVALGVLHEASGIVVFILGFVFLIFIARWLKSSVRINPEIPETNSKVGVTRELSHRSRELRNFLILSSVIVVCVILEGYLVHASARMYSRQNLTRLPYTLGEWEGVDVPVDNTVYQILETKDVLIREYNDGKGVPVVLAIVYSARNRDSFHPPEYCYLGSGLQLVDKRKDIIQISPERKLVVNKLVMHPSRSEGGITAWYWYAAEKKFMASYYKQQLVLLADILRGRTPAGALIRISVEGTGAPVQARAKEFIRAVLPEIDKIF